MTWWNEQIVGVYYNARNFGPLAIATIKHPNRRCEVFQMKRTSLFDLFIPVTITAKLILVFYFSFVFNRSVLEHSAYKLL